MKEKEMEELCGKKFGRLTILSFNPPKIYEYAWKVKMYSVNCICECGNYHTADYQALKRGLAKSCGCFNKERAKENFTTHGLTMKDGKKRLEYSIWSNMKRRCIDINNKDYHHYGGRGIKICEDWLKGFEFFFRDMGERPSTKYSLERIDVNGDYCKENCVWILKSKQNSNTRRVQPFTYLGKTQILPLWAEELNISYAVLRHRVYELKLSLEEAINYIPTKGQGIKNGSAKLTEEQVIEIFLSKEKSVNIVNRYNVHVETIRGIRRGKKWKHITDKLKQ